MIKIDSHLHALKSNPDKDYINRNLWRIKAIIDTAASKGLDAIVLTDFGHTQGFNVIDERLLGNEYELRKIESGIIVGSQKYKKPIAVFRGEEIPTKNGEIIGAFLDSYIESGKSTEETIKQIEKQGGVVIFPHPLATFPGAGGIGEKELRKCSKLSDYVAIEILNGQLTFPFSGLNEKARELAEELGVCKVGNSDARGYWRNQYKRVGEVSTIYPITEVSKETIREAVKNRNAEVEGNLNNPLIVWVMMGSVVLKKLVGK